MPRKSRDGEPYAIDFTNPAPDMDFYSITEKYFKIRVEEMARFAIKVVKEGRKPEDPNGPTGGIPIRY